MSENLQKLLKEAFLNNSYDYDSMDKELIKAWNNSYSYLYTLQKTYVEYEELFYYSNDDISRNTKLIGELYLDKWNYANFDVDYDLIHVYSREEFRLSKFYDKPYTLEDIRNNPTIFLKMPIVIIDDQVIWDFNIFSRKDKTTIGLPFRRNFVISLDRNPETGDIVYLDHKIQVLVVDNKFYERIKVNKNTIGFNATEKTITIPKSLFTEKIPTSAGTNMASLHIPSRYGKNYELGSAFIPLKDDDNGNMVGQLTDDLNVLLHNTGYDFYLSVVHISRLFDHNFYYGGNVATVDENNNGNLIVVQEEEMIPYKMPVPVEDFMVFRRQPDEEGFILVKNTDVLELHYPNIYFIKDEERQVGTEYRIFYFYYENYDLKYTVLFDFYFRFLLVAFSQMSSIEEVLDGIYRDTIDYSKYTDEQLFSFKEVFANIIAYKYYNHLYGEMDFLYRYTKLPGNEDKEPIEYKDEILKSWIKVEPHVLRDYVREQKKLGESYHLFTNTINLEERLRYDTSHEFDPTDQYTFDEARYVFAMENPLEYPMLLECRVYVDGLFVMNLIQLRRLYMDYLYIPASMVTDDSYIEIEIFPSYSFKQDMIFTSLDDVKEITLTTPKEAIWPTLKDVYFTSPDTPGVRYDEEYFDFTPHYYDRYDDIGEILAYADDTEKPVKYTRLTPFTFKIKPNDPTVLNIPFTMHFDKNSLRLRATCTKRCYPVFRFVSTEWNWNFNADYMRIYRNGRLLPRCKYQFNHTFSEPRLLIFEKFEENEIIMIDISPYRYTQIFYEDELEKNPLISLIGGEAIIDLREILNKPFDIRYYDVYMNGRKLSINNVFTISPYQITLVNLKSLYNLEIYEKERDWEYFGVDYKENIYYYTIDDLFNENFISDEERDKLILDMIEEQKDPRLNIYPNTNDEERMDHTDVRKWAQFYMFYHYELIPKTYYNPDRLQENQEVMKDIYFYIHKYYTRIPYTESSTMTEMKRRRLYPKVLMLDPDITVGEDNPNNLYYVFPVGHLEDTLPEEYRDQVVLINNDPDIYKHKGG